MCLIGVTRCSLHCNIILMRIDHTTNVFSVHFSTVGSFTDSPTSDLLDEVAWTMFKTFGGFCAGCGKGATAPIAANARFLGSMTGSCPTGASPIAMSN